MNEPLVRLRAEGLIDIEAHRGFRVRPLSAAEVDEVFRLRLTLEPAAVAIGAKLASAGDHAAAPHSGPHRGDARRARDLVVGEAR